MNGLLRIGFRKYEKLEYRVDMLGVKYVGVFILFRVMEG
jgi:hypothetical protein